MPIELFGNGGATITGDSIEFFRLCTLRSAVGLEMHGIKVRRGPVVWKQVAKEFGIKGNKQAVFDWLDAKVREESPKQERIQK
jgi:hypothetical protein